jgi:MtN3 and saliva related transmembrane protein
MQFDIIDHNVSTTTNVFLVVANIINLFYNIPQMYKTYKCKSTKDFSTTFLLLRIIGNTIWIEYAIEVNSLLMLTNNIVTVISSLFIGYYKLNELFDYYYKKHYIENNDKEVEDKDIEILSISDTNVNIDNNIDNNIENADENNHYINIDIDDAKNKLL